MIKTKFLNNQLFSHRGIHNNKTFVENSLTAFKKSLLDNMNIELDIQMTKDNQIIVFHDKNLKRLLHINKLVKDVTYEEIKDIKLLQTKDNIPLLEEVLKLIENKVILNIEIKKVSNIKQFMKNLFSILNKYNVKYVITSFDYRIIFWLTKNKKDIIKGILISGNKKNKRINKIILSKFASKILNYDFISYNKTLVNDKNIKKYRNKKHLMIWPIENKLEVEKYKENAQSFIIS